MKTFYFTYGCDSGEGVQPYSGGWTEVVAKDKDTAINIFSAVHPSSCGCLDCAFVYDEETFNKSFMKGKGNFGKFCHERITLSVERFD